MLGGKGRVFFIEEISGFIYLLGKTGELKFFFFFFFFSSRTPWYIATAPNKSNLLKSKIRYHP